MQRTPYLWISTGELSGDRLGAWLLRSMSQTLSCPWVGIPGPALRALGVEALLPMERLQLMGIGELRELPIKELLTLVTRISQGTGSARSRSSVLSASRYLERFFSSWPQSSQGVQVPLAGAVFVDYGGFHLCLGTLFALKGIPIAYLAPPKLWAWGRFRAPLLKSFHPILGVLFPFEVEFYRELGFEEVIHVGHPVAELLKLPRKEPRFRLYLLPGSRPQEWRAHLPLLLTMVPTLRRYPLQLTLGIPPHLKDLPLPPLPREVERKFIATPEEYQDGALAIAASGTVNLELAALGIPHVIFYNPHPVTYLLGRVLVKLPWVNPVNLVAQKEILREFLGGEAQPHKMLPYVEELWEKREAMGEILRGVVTALHQPQGLKRFEERILAFL